jgi:hypothetical protein
MAWPEILLRGTAWISLAAWAASEWRRSRALFVAGGVALLAHSAVAFHVRYGWSQQAALLDTREQTRAVTGLAFGGGLIVNYLFLLLWLAEIVWWWRSPAGYLARPPLLDRAIRAFFLFMFLNGAVVFASGPVRALGVAAVLAVAWAWYRRGRGEGAVHASR